MELKCYESGKTVEEYWGDSDYSSISKEEVNKLYVLFNLPPGSKKELLVVLQSSYHTNTCNSEIQNLLEHHNIRHEGFL